MKDRREVEWSPIQRNAKGRREVEWSLIRRKAKGRQFKGMQRVAGKSNVHRFEGMQRVAVELNRRRLALNGASSATVGAQWRRWELNRDDGSSTATVGS